MTRRARDGRDEQPLRIVVQNGEHWMRNIGDLAMLSVTLRRLRSRWPGASLHVMTSVPALLRAYHPDVHPISDGRLPGFLAEPLSAAASRLGPSVAGFASLGSLRAREELRRVVERLRKRSVAPEGVPAEEAGPDDGGPDISTRPAVAAALRDASLVLAIGGGYMNDVDPWQFHRTLDLLQHGIDRGIPTAMVGQGFGPLTEPALVARAAEVLPAVHLIALREDRVGPSLLAGLGVRAERVLVTGDDAIELAHTVRRDALGAGLGVCLRVAGYSPVAVRSQEAVGRAVRAVAGEFAARLVPLVVSEQGSEDRRSTLPLVAAYPDVAPVQGRFVTPQEVARRVGRCRLVVTGAYHLAVFALSQGIPVVGLSSSRYYDEKLHGLDAMFGGHGLHVVRLDDPALEERVASAARTAWERAPEVRAPLRERASAQIQLGKVGFERVFSLVDEPSIR
ncbi:polysaccharide pyruvyl transferase family protein [Pseudonocardia adelaidensis]|uniref:Polysaccharide pyruvyl transferase domain-containing protein n=1 Tax=Pseudonocardia adelaidensis TaxID=648754 RepID=A0ABP9NC74_9PSEU